MRNELLGYLLGALDKEEHAQVESTLAQDRALQSDAELLRKGLAPLEADREHFEPSADLWRRTVEFVMLRAGLHGGPGAADADVVVRPAPVWTDGPAPTRRWRLVDISVAAGILVAAMSVVVPAVIQSRANAQRMACAERLQETHAGLASFAEMHNRLLPVASVSDGAHGKAGIYAPLLLDAGYLGSENSVFCPGTEPPDEEFTIPSLKQLESAKGRELLRLIRRMGGTYAIGIGYRENGKYRPLMLRVGDNFPLMADLPGANGKPRGHHGGCGQNILMADGQVLYIYAPCWPRNRDHDIYTNDEGKLDAGMRSGDSVLAPSEFGPIFDREELQIRNVDR